MKKRRLFQIFRMCGYLVGFSVLLYPTVSNYINVLHSTTVASNYEQEVSHTSEEQEKKLIADALAYNQRLIGSSPVLDPFSDTQKKEPPDYEQQLRIDSGGMMGYIEIPKIKVLLPIYHGTSEAVLQTGVGHLENTSLPVGGESSHTVLSGHRGLPSAKLFSDLDKMGIGDIFYIKVLHNTFAYQTDQILTVLPTETGALSIEAGKDYVTLVTCTPYAINTHRLLIRGTRIPYEEAVAIEPQKAEIEQGMPLHIKALIAGIGAVLMMGGLLMIVVRKKRREEKHEKEA